MALTLESRSMLAGHTPLKDGRAVMIRPIRVDDAGLLQSFVRALSPASRRNRFQASLTELSPTALARLTRIDYPHDYALVAQAETADTLLGEARFVVVEPAHCAEFAIAVSDGWQGVGLATRMFAALKNAARGAGLIHLIGDVLRTNLPMLAFARRLGFALERHPDPLLVRVRMRLASD